MCEKQPRRNRPHPKSRFAAVLLSAFVIATGLTPEGAGASTELPDGGRDALERRLGPGTEVAHHSRTGLVRFIGTAPGRPITRPSGVKASASAPVVARAFLERYGFAFGISDQAAQLRTIAVGSAPGDRFAVRFQQLHDGVPVLGGELVVNLDAHGNLLSAGGETLPEGLPAVVPRVPAGVARDAALAAVAKKYGVARARLSASRPRLWIYDSRIMGGPGLGIPTLVWRTTVARGGWEPIDELVLVDARLGSVVVQFSQIEDAKNRVICDANGTAAQVPCVSPVRSEGGPASAIADVNSAYEFAGDTYDFYFSNFGRDSLDGAGMTLASTVRFCPSPAECPYQNAFWTGNRWSTERDSPPPTTSWATSSPTG